MKELKDTKCKDCCHSSYLGGIGTKILACLYIIDTGEPRGCVAGETCDKYEKGVRKGKV